MSKSKKHKKLSAAQKLTVVTGTASLNEVELSEYCRKDGEQWTPSANVRSNHAARLM